jgi:hypothetical protein
MRRFRAVCHAEGAGISAAASTGRGFSGWHGLVSLVRTFPSVLVLAGLLQSNPACAQAAQNQAPQNQAPQNQATQNQATQNQATQNQATENQATENHSLENQAPEKQAGPTAGHETGRSPEDILATISRSRSTNTRGYKVVIRKDGSATMEISGASTALRVGPARAQQFPPTTVDTKTLRRLLIEIGDVSRIPTGGCPKSASFGTRTQITYAGKTSGDLQCIRAQASDSAQAPLQVSEELGRFVETTLGQLKISGNQPQAH